MKVQVIKTGSYKTKPLTNCPTLIDGFPPPAPPK
jgi:hypothetical protein